MKAGRHAHLHKLILGGAMFYSSLNAERLIRAGVISFSLLLNACGGSGSTHVDPPAVDLETVKADMGLNDASLLNAPTMDGWPKRASVEMGAAARGDATPTWWTPANLAYKSSAAWNAIAPWFVIYPGSAHTATNVRVKVSNLEIYLLSKSTNTWNKLDTGTNPGWSGNYDFKLITNLGSSTLRKEPDGLPSYKLDKSFHPVHGGIGKFPIAGADVAAVFGKLTAQLVLDDPKGVDDLSSAQLLVSIGADYYPSMDASVAKGSFLPLQYVPQVASSKFWLVTKDAKTHYFATIDGASGTNIVHASDFYKAGGKTTISLTQFSANPPPGL